MSKQYNKKEKQGRRKRYKARQQEQISAAAKKAGKH